MGKADRFVAVVAPDGSSLGARPYPKTLTTNSQQEVIGTPGAGYRTVIEHISCSNGQAVQTVVQVREGSAGMYSYTYVLAPNGGGGGDSFPNGYNLPEDTPVYAVQDVNAGPTYLTILARVEQVTPES